MVNPVNYIVLAVVVKAEKIFPTTFSSVNAVVIMGIVILIPNYFDVHVLAIVSYRYEALNGSTTIGSALVAVAGMVVAVGMVDCWFVRIVSSVELVDYNLDVLLLVVLIVMLLELLLHVDSLMQDVVATMEEIVVVVVALVLDDFNMLVSNIPSLDVDVLPIVNIFALTMEIVTSAVEHGTTNVYDVFVHVVVLVAVVVTNGLVLVSKLHMVVPTVDEGSQDNVLVSSMFVVHQPP